MIELRSSRRLEEAYGKKVDNLLAKSFDEAISVFCADAENYGFPIGVETSSDSKLRIKIRCKSLEFDSFKQGFRVFYLDVLARNLELSNSEVVEFGERISKGRIGNNSAFPIYVLTKTRKILLGYYHSNQDVAPSSHYIFVKNTLGENVYPNTVQLYMLG